VCAQHVVPDGAKRLGKVTLDAKVLMVNVMTGEKDEKKSKRLVSLYSSPDYPDGKMQDKNNRTGWLTSRHCSRTGVGGG
jgi:hypothetical protein